MKNRRLLAVNVAVVIALVWGGFKIRESSRAFEGTHQPEFVQAEPDNIVLPTVTAKPVVPAASGEWTETATRNPFSFDRNDTNLVVQVAAPAVQQVSAGPVPILYGTLSLGGPPVAILGDGGGTRRSPGLKVGEAFGGWKIVEINDNTVLVASNGRQESLVKGAVPRERTEVTRTAGTEQPVINPLATQPAASSAQTILNPYNVNLNPSLPAVPPPGTVIEQTPFGARLVTPLPQ